MTQARFIARQSDSFEQAASVFADLFKRQLTGHERLQLIEMLEAVARTEMPSEPQIEAIAALKPMLGLVPAR